MCCNNNYANNHCHSNYNQSNNCCLKHVEETFLCCPSYYAEEKENYIENQKEETTFPCYEGYFRLCPTKSKCHSKQENVQDNDCKCHSNRKCNFCNMFGGSF